MFYASGAKHTAQNGAQMEMIYRLVSLALSEHAI